MPTRLSLGSFSLAWDLTMKKGVGQSYTNWSGVGATLLISSRQDETSQHRGMKCGVASLGLMKASMYDCHTSLCE